MAFSYDHHAFNLDPACCPTSPIGMLLLPQQAEELNCAPSWFVYSYPSAGMIPYVSGTDAKTCNRSSSPNSATDTPSVDNDSPKTGEPHSLEKEKKKKDETCFMTTTIHAKDAEVSMICRFSKTRGAQKETGNKRKRAARSGEPQVRARGQATDSHSLAERVRRERIRQKMKMLQGLVPGCEKANGKAQMLDEIINYVQSLQNQVEFLSMRLVSLSPMLYGFALDMDDHSNLREKIIRRMPQNMLPANHRIHLETTTSANESTSYHGVVDNSAPNLLQRQGQGPNPTQEPGSSVVQAGEGRPLLRQIELVNICCFQ